MQTISRADFNRAKRIYRLKHLEYGQYNRGMIFGFETLLGLTYSTRNDINRENSDMFEVSDLVAAKIKAVLTGSPHTVTLLKIADIKYGKSDEEVKTGPIREGKRQ